MNRFDPTAKDTDEQEIDHQVFPVGVDKGVGQIPPNLFCFVPAIRDNYTSQSLFCTLSVTYKMCVNESKRVVLKKAGTK